MRVPGADLLEFLKPFPAAVIDLALALRDIVFEEAPGSSELVYDAYSAVAIGFTYSGRFKDAYCHIAVYSGHVNLGFNKGSLLADQQKLLKGDGRWIRHISIRKPEDLARPHVRTFLRAALEHVDQSTPLGKTIVKRTAGAKRRPPARKNA